MIHDRLGEVKAVGWFFIGNGEEVTVHTKFEFKG